MKITFSKMTFKLLLIVLVLFSTFTQAHVGLKNTQPVKGAMLMNSPEKLSLRFSGEVKVVKLRLEDASGISIDFGFKPSADATSDFEWLLPKLKASNYQVDWIVMGKDGHKMKGKFGFMVH